MDHVAHNEFVSFIWGIADVHQPEPEAEKAPEIAETEDDEEVLEEAA